MITTPTAPRQPGREPAREPEHLARFAVAAAFALVVFGIVSAASLCDDAYITLRTVDNFVHGYGLRWNIDERVQTYSHPLWMFVLSGVYVFTREPYYTTLAVSLVAALASLVLLARVARTPMTAALVLLVAGASHAFVDYSTSGLENPLSNALIALYAVLLFRRPRSLRRLFWLALVAALLLLNRLDYALLIGPSLARELWKLRSRRALGVVLAGVAPLVAWELFSASYYGSFVPNTAYAKLTNQFPRATLLYHGWCWAWFTISRDWLTAIVVVAAIVAAAWQRRARGLTCAAGCLSYILYTIYIGGDFMAGRFWLGPFVFALAYLAQCPQPAVRLTLLMGLVSTALLPVRTATFGGVAGAPIGHTHVVWDDRAYYAKYTGLTTVGLHARGPIHELGRLGLAVGKERRVIVMQAVGMYAYYGGPQLHAVDQLALADPLLARLQPLPYPDMEPGHLWRALPDGYVRSIEDGRNEIVEPHLHEFYDHLSLVMRAPLWSPARLWTALQLLAGRYQPLLRDYESSPSAAVQRASLKPVPRE
jgi:arabinofuranosyltransferase